MIIKFLHDPMLFQGKKKAGRYFEGWYFKQVSEDLKKSISIIPGIALDEKDSHAFVQTIISIDSGQESRLETHYHRFSTKDFFYENEPFSLKIGSNIFRNDGIEIDLANEKYSLKGEIHFSEFTKIRTSLISPGIMGYFTYLPFMECYHGIISMSHFLKGYLLYNGELLNFNNGKGYIEKDWGTSFPREYLWVQSNNFGGSDASVTCAVADIPFLGSSFRGFICNLTFDSKEYRFATYNCSKMTKVDCRNGIIDIEIVKGNLKFELRAEISDGGSLKAPRNGGMNSVISEGLRGVVKVRLFKKPGEILFDGEGKCCGIELVKNAQPV